MYKDKLSFLIKPEKEKRCVKCGKLLKYDFEFQNQLCESCEIEWKEKDKEKESNYNNEISKLSGEL